MAKQCPNCQQLLDEAVKFCPICGVQVSEVRPVDAPIEIAEGRLPPPLIPETPSRFDSIPQAPGMSPAMLPANPPLVKPALMAGCLMALLSALPIVSCCCLIWLVGGGVLAVYFLRNEMDEEITAGLGARLGLLTALVGAVVWQVLDLPISFIDSRGEGLRHLEEMIRSTENLPPESLQMLEWVFARFATPFSAFAIVFGLVSKLLMCSVLTTLGGVLGVAFFGKVKTPTPPAA